MNPNVKYTQQVDEKTGKITFVPDTPPEQSQDQDQSQQNHQEGQGEQQPQDGNGNPQNEGQGEKGNTGKGEGSKHDNGEETEKGQGIPDGSEKVKKKRDINEIIGKGELVVPAYYLEEIIKGQDEIADDYFDFSANTKLTELLGNLEANNKKLRYAKRLQGGKLDGRRLTAYKTSDRLFKKKAIKHKDYQFNILIDTSGSMFHDSLMTAMSAVAKTVKSLEALGLPVAVWSMNLGTGLVKDYKEPFNEQQFIHNMRIMGAAMLIDRQRYDHLSDDEFNKMLENVRTDKTQNALYRVSGKELAGGTIENVAYEQSLAYSKANSGAKTKPVFIVLSDGEPGGSLSKVPVMIGDEIEYVEMPDGGNQVGDLRKWWERKSGELTAYGIGIYSACGQVPNSQTINDLEKLPEVMSDLVQQIIF